MKAKAFTLALQSLRSGKHIFDKNTVATGWFVNHDMGELIILTVIYLYYFRFSSYLLRHTGGTC